MSKKGQLCQAAPELLLPQSDAVAAGAEQSDARDGAAAVLDAATQGDDALRDAGADDAGAGDAGFEDDAGFGDGGCFDDDHDDESEQVWAQQAGVCAGV